MKNPIRWLAIAVLLAVLGSVRATPDTVKRPAQQRSLESLVASNSNALWHVVHDVCVRDMQIAGIPAPCARVDLRRGFAVLNDIDRPNQLLLVPTDRISGIEDPRLLAAGSTNYWQAAWESRDIFEKTLGRPIPREFIGMAINSVQGRNQNQLHIHIDCIRPHVLHELKIHADDVGPSWSEFPETFGRHHYRAMRLDGLSLGSQDPFKLLADGDVRARADMSRQTLVVVGAIGTDGRPGFILLSDYSDPATHDSGHGEELLDPHCKVLEATE